MKRFRSVPAFKTTRQSSTNTTNTTSSSTMMGGANNVGGDYSDYGDRGGDYTAGFQEYQGNSRKRTSSVAVSGDTNSYTTLQGLFVSVFVLIEGTNFSPFTTLFLHFTACITKSALFSAC